MATYTKLDSYTVGAGGASSVTFSNITQGYTDLVIKVSSRNTYSGVADDINVYFNGVTTNRTGRILYGNGASAASATLTGSTGTTTSNTATANTFGSTDIYITNYGSSSAYKSISSDSGAENNATTAYDSLFASLWSSTDAVTSITIQPNTGNWMQYSTFTLYGVYKGAETTITQAPTIGTATAGNASASVAFTAPATTDNIASYVATSTPGSITGSGTSSPVTVSGLTNGTAYTFKVKAVNPNGYGPESSASNSITPVDPASYESIATYTTTAGQSVVTFNSIPQTYKHLQVRMTLRSQAPGVLDSLQATFNNDSGSNYNILNFRLNNAAWGYNNYNSSSYLRMVNLVSGAGASSGASIGMAILDVFDYTNSSSYKTGRYYGGTNNSTSTNNFVSTGTYSYTSTTAISRMDLIPSNAAFAAGSTISLYGIKG